MGWAWRVATVAGIPIYVHGTFAVLVVFLLISGLSAGRGLVSAFSGVLFILAVFTTIILHEFGHALTARRFGIKTRDITLFPIGGLARLERIPEVPRQELWVALAGPAVNVVIGATCYLVFAAATGSPPVLSLAQTGTDFVGRFTSVNLMIAIFNMVPAFPMDGGRVMRALLAERVGYVRATKVAANVAQGLALVFGLVGLFVNPWLIFIALFVWMGASGEAAAATMRGALAGVPVNRAMMTDFRSVEADRPLQDVMELTLRGTQRDFPVIADGRLVGILTRDQLLVALTERGRAGLVREAMVAEFETADVEEMLDTVYARLQSAPCSTMPVLFDGRLVGLLTPESVAECVMFFGALRPARRFFTWRKR